MPIATTNAIRSLSTEQPPSEHNLADHLQSIFFVGAVSGATGEGTRGAGVVRNLLPARPVELIPAPSCNRVACRLPSEGARRSRSATAPSRM